MTAHEAEARLDALCERLAAGAAPDPERDATRAELGALLARVETVLKALAEEHGHLASPLVE